MLNITGYSKEKLLGMGIKYLDAKEITVQILEHLEAKKPGL